MTGPQCTAKLGSGWVRVVMSKALLISVTGDRRDVPVWDSCIKPQGYGCRADAMVGVGLGQGPLKVATDQFVVFLISC